MKLWKKLSDEEKIEYKEKAIAENDAADNE